MFVFTLINDKVHVYCRDGNLRNFCSYKEEWKPLRFKGKSQAMNRFNKLSYKYGSAKMITLQDHEKQIFTDGTVRDQFNLVTRRWDIVSDLESITII